MDREKQQKAPFVEALEGYCQQHMKAYHTPGHKLGQGISAYQADLFGDALRRDLGVMYALDDLFQPEGALKEAMELAADLYGAGRTFFQDVEDERHFLRSELDSFLVCAGDECHHHRSQ